MKTPSCMCCLPFSGVDWGTRRTPLLSTWFFASRIFLCPTIVESGVRAEPAYLLQSLML